MNLLRWLISKFKKKSWQPYEWCEGCFDMCYDQNKNHCVECGYTKEEDQND